MVTDTREPSRNYQIPDAANKVKDEFPRLGLAITAIGYDVLALQTSMSSKAALSHTHSISNVTGLQTALDGKAAIDHQHTFNELSDVDTAGVAQWQVPMWDGTKWVPWTVDTAHITGVVSVDLSNYYTKTQVDAAVADINSLRAAQVFNSGASNLSAGQTSFTVAGGYTVGYIDVFLNGVRLGPSDYTASNGTTVILGAGVASGDELVLIPWKVNGLTNLGSYALTSYVDGQLAGKQPLSVVLSTFAGLGWTAGDIPFVTTGNAFSRLPKGTDGQVLYLSSGFPAWGGVSARLGADMSVVAGDILYGSGAGTLARLAKGTDGQILTLASGLPSWAAAPSTGVAKDNGSLAVGSYAFVRVNPPSNLGDGGTVAGSNLRPVYYNSSSATWVVPVVSISGTWRNTTGATIPVSTEVFAVLQRIA